MRHLDALRRLAGYVRAVLLDPWRSGPLVWSLVGVFLAISIFRYTSLTAPNHDVAWLLLAAGRMLDGGTYLTEFYEVNWPMAIMIYCPGVWLSRLLGLDLYAGFLTYLFVLIGGSVFIAAKMLRRLLPDLPAVSGVLIVTYAWVLLLLPRHSFGQREHIAVALFLPFVIAAACRPRRGAVIEYGISVAASIGALVKPHFILLPAAIFGMRLLRERSWRVFGHMDVLIFLISGIVYIVVVCLVFPGWFAVAKSALQLYAAYDGEWDGLVRTGGVGLASALLVLIVNRAAAIPPVANALVARLGITAAAASLIFMLQRKGWSYHFYPAAAALTLLVMAFAGAYLATAEPAKIRRRHTASCLSVCLMLSVGIMPVAREIWRDYHRSVLYRSAPLPQMVRATNPGEAMFVFSANVADAFPMVLLEKRNWASRFSSLWPVFGIATQLAEDQTPAQRERLRLLRRSAIEMTVADFRRYRPGIVLVRVDTDRAKFKNAPDFLSFYRVDPAFEAIWRRYRPAGRVGRFELYVRSGADD